MKIYFAHSTGFDFKKGYYEPIESSSLAQTNDLIFPHKDDGFVNTKDVIMSCDLVVAEVSFPSTGLGIELGWASDMNKLIVAVYKIGTKPSRSLKVITDNFIEYSSDNELVEKLTEFLLTFNNKFHD